MVIFLGLYFMFSAVYRLVLTDEQQLIFEKVALYCNHYTSYIPLTFMLGFYVTMVVDRFNRTYNSLAWPDQTMLLLATFMPGKDEPTRIVRRTIARYMSLANILVLRDISTAVRKRFPSMEHLINAGFMTDEELITYQTFPCPHHKFWMVMQWTILLLQKSLDDGKIKSERYLIALIEEVNKYRCAIGQLFSFDWISIPLVYTQVVTIAVYSFFLACLLGRQFLHSKTKSDITHPKGELDIFVPLFTVLQFIFYMGWLKVAETLINPLGEDDDDFELNYLIDRNLQLSYLMIDNNNYSLPSLTRDVHWDEEVAEIAHTSASFGIKADPEIGSAVPVNVTGEAAEQFLPSECGTSVGSRLTGISSIGPTRLASIDTIRNRLSMRKKSSKSKSVMKSSGDRKHSAINLPRRKVTGFAGHSGHTSWKTPQRKEPMMEKFLATVDPGIHDFERGEQPFIDEVDIEDYGENINPQSAVLESIVEEGDVEGQSGKNVADE